MRGHDPKLARSCETMKTEKRGCRCVDADASECFEDEGEAMAMAMAMAMTEAEAIVM